MGALAHSDAPVRQAGWAGCCGAMPVNRRAGEAGIEAGVGSKKSASATASVELLNHCVKAVSEAEAAKRRLRAREGVIVGA
eukprot:scaffold198688_cov26-Tisochrysis_lutea.AAC.2